MYRAPAREQAGVIERGARGGEPTTVVVVDDHAGFRTMVSVLLAAGGFRVVGAAATGAQALVMVAALVPDVVLLDVQLPDTDGFAVLEALRHAGIPTRVVLCSVRSATDYGARLEGCGATGFLAKSALTVGALRSLLAAG